MKRRARLISVVPAALAAVLLLTTCTELWGPLDSRYDEAGDNYQGYPTVPTADQITAVTHGEFIWVPELVAAEVVGATGYEFQVAESADFATPYWSHVSDSNVAASAEVEVGGSQQYWRVRAQVDGEWGAWSDHAALAFLTMVIPREPSSQESVNVFRPTFTWDSPETTDFDDPDPDWDMPDEWASIEPLAGYQLQLGPVSAALSEVEPVSVADATYTPADDLLNNTEYHWRVRAVSESDQLSAWCDASTFSVLWGEITYMTPFDANFVDSTTPTLQWEEIADADSYELQLADTEAGVDSATVESVATNAYTVPTAIPRESSRFWRVRAVTGAESGPWTEIIEFIVPQYVIGDTGPAGGVVFYVNSTDADWWTYLEAAPSDQSTGTVWGGYQTLVGGTGTGIGTGGANTDEIVSAYGATEPYQGRSDYAAKLCEDLELNEYVSWFLPSIDELNELYRQRSVVGGFSAVSYWSSSESGSQSAWLQDFADGTWSTYPKDGNSFRVRAIRAF